tara:strand:- start:102 stop:473 length:372 start_codon:yes stop_codon:yes gene_type:complete
MRFIDSNIIAYAFYDNPYTESCQKILRKEGIVNTFVLIEAFHIIEKEVNKEKAIESVKAILKSHIRIVEVDTNMIFEAIKRTNKLSLTVFDCIHYTTAKLNGCTEIISYDKDFDNLDIPRKEP